MNKKLFEKLYDLEKYCKDQIKEIRKELEEPDELDRPENWQLFWYVTGYGYQTRIKWSGGPDDFFRLGQGNCFWGDGAEERCKEYKTALHTQVRIRELGGKNGIPDYSEEWWELYVDVSENKIRIDNPTHDRAAYFWFESNKIALEVLQTIGQESLIHMVKNGVAL